MGKKGNQQKYLCSKWSFYQETDMSWSLQWQGPKFEFNELFIILNHLDHDIHT